MPDSSSSTELKVTAAALREASALCRAVQQTLDYGVLEKGDRSPVTVADYGSQALVCRKLKEAFPADEIVAEEDASALRKPGQQKVADQVVRHVLAVHADGTPEDVLQWIDYGSGTPGPGRFWTLDPIDGTKGFLRARQYAVALALIEYGRVRLGALACPNLDGGLLLTAELGKGARCCPLHQDHLTDTIHVSTTYDAAAARLCESVESGHSAHGHAYRAAQHLGISTEPVRLDSQAKYAVVARAQADIYLRLPTRKGYEEKIWDHAAGALILSEAGGTVTDMCGKALDFSQGRTLAQNTGIVATNGHLHSKVIEAISALGIGQHKA